MDRDDSYQDVLKDTHETIGKLRALIDSLSSNISALEHEIHKDDNDRGTSE